MQRILVDTNLIVRFFIEGDRWLVELAAKNEVYIPEAVVFEVVFVLTKLYKVTREETAGKLIELLAKVNIESEREVLIETLAVFRDNPTLGVVDCYLKVLARLWKVELETYDKKLRRKINDSNLKSAAFRPGMKMAASVGL